MFLGYLCYFYVKCKSLYKFPTRFFFFPFPSDILMFFCYFGGRFCYPFNHPSTSLFFSIYLHVQKNKTSHLCCPAVMTILLSAVVTVKFKPQTTNQTILEGGREGAQKHDVIIGKHLGQIGIKKSFN